MALVDPVAVYNAATNLEAHLVCDALVEAGIDAHVVEDVSVVGAWFGGLLPEIHKPQVWVNRSDRERAQPVIAAYEANAARQRETLTDDDPITVTCEECGTATVYPAQQIDSVQVCPACHAYVDVIEKVPWTDSAAEDYDAQPGDAAAEDDGTSEGDGTGS